MYEVMRQRLTTLPPDKLKRCGLASFAQELFSAGNLTEKMMMLELIYNADLARILSFNPPSRHRLLQSGPQVFNKELEDGLTDRASNLTLNSDHPQR